MPGQLFLRRCSVSLAGRTVVRDVSLTVGPRARLGLLGPNGVGKSTVLRVGAGLLVPDEGSVERSPADLTVGYLEQEPLAGHDETMLEMLARRTGVAAAQRDADRLSADMGHDLDRIQRYTEALARVETLGGYDLEARASRAVHDLGLPVDALDRSVSTLSGGQRARAALAAITLARFDVLLLDEPTNDLDVDTLRALEDALLEFGGCVVVISHDRWFLDRIATHMLAFEGDSVVTWFEGNYQDYEVDRHRRLGTEADQPHRIKYRKLVR
jgi:ATPase subunit of ABC transporter with duplicated ATPase domains